MDGLVRLTSHQKFVGPNGYVYTVYNNNPVNVTLPAMSMYQWQSSPGPTGHPGPTGVPGSPGYINIQNVRASSSSIKNLFSKDLFSGGWSSAVSSEKPKLWANDFWKLIDLYTRGGIEVYKDQADSYYHVFPWNLITTHYVGTLKVIKVNKEGETFLFGLKTKLTPDTTVPSSDIYQLLFSVCDRYIEIRDVISAKDVIANRLKSWEFLGVVEQYTTHGKYFLTDFGKQLILTNLNDTIKVLYEHVVGCEITQSICKLLIEIVPKKEWPALLMLASASIAEYLSDQLSLKGALGGITPES